jgi:hypothetical protein
MTGLLAEIRTLDLSNTKQSCVNNWNTTFGDTV